MGHRTDSADLGDFKRYTVVLSYKDEYLSSRTRLTTTETLNFGAFDINELRYIPMTNPKEEWTIETRDEVVYLADTIPTVHVYGKQAIPRFEGGERKIVGFGNLKTNRSEERRVGKECRSRWSRCHEKKKKR